jgi:hypothetical protein
MQGNGKPANSDGDRGMTSANTSRQERVRILLFCTAFANNYHAWRHRYTRWLEGIRTGGLEYDQILLIDDCSPVLPNWPNLEIIGADGVALPEKALVMARFSTHLGKRQGLRYSTSPGWFRSFAYAAQYARAGGFDKIVHVESDTFIISRQLEAFINQLDTGWTALWCPLHKFPEDNIQIIVGNSINDYSRFFGETYFDVFDNMEIEKQYPFTCIERRFIGDRYGDYSADVPINADFVAQARSRRTDYFWWLADRPCPARDLPQIANGQNVPMLQDELFISKKLAGSRTASSEDVECAYNLFLSRDPENTNATNERTGVTIPELFSEFFMSAEFRIRVLPGIVAGVEPAFLGSKPLSVLKEWLLHVLGWADEDRRIILSSTGSASLMLQALRSSDVVSQLIEDTGSGALFDLAYYSKSRGLQFSSLKEAVHDYLSMGAAAGADPNVVFDTDWYETTYVGANAGRINPLVHFLLRENFYLTSPFPLFDSKWYARAFLGGSASTLNALVHYLTVGVDAGIE